MKVLMFWRRQSSRAIGVPPAARYRLYETSSLYAGVLPTGYG